MAPQNHPLKLVYLVFPILIRTLNGVDSLFHPKVRWGEDKHFQCSAWRLER